MAKIDTGLIAKYSWMPIPVIFISIASLEIAGEHQAYDNGFLVMILNLIFSTTASLLIVYLISRSFLVSGRSGLIFISCGVLSWGLAGFSANLFGGDDVNRSITIHNLCVLISSLFYFSGAIIFHKQNRGVRYPGMWLTVLYSATLTIIILIIVFALNSRIPLFFIQAVGGSALRFFVLSSSILMFIATSLILRMPGKGFLPDFSFWYSRALLLIAIGLFGVMLENKAGDIQSWFGRSAQYLAGVYMIFAAFASVKETHVWELSIEDELGKARQQTRKQKELNAHVLESMYDSVIVTDERFFITAWNKAAELLYGWRAEEVIGKNSRDILRSELQGSDLRKLLADLNETGVSLNETNQHRKDGSIVNVEARLTVIRDENFNITGYVAVNRDITERKRSEEALRASEQRLKFHFENSPLAVVEWDYDFIVTQWSIEAERIFGWKKSDVLGKRIDTLNIIFEEDLPIVNRTMDKLTSGREQTVISTNRNYRKTGEVIECTWYNSVLLDDNNRMSSIMSLVEDITEQKKAEKEREQLLSELKEAQMKLNIALENGRIGIWEWDLVTDRVVWDERMERMYGILPGSFGGTYKSFEALVNEEDIYHVNKAFTATLENNMPFETIFRVRSTDGKARYISSKALLNRDENNKPLSLTGVSFDVTEMREGTEKLILKLNEELLRSNKELENFAYVASHDLQEPLRMVSSFTQLLARQYGDKLDSKAKEYIMFAVDGARRMYDLINGLLSYSRIHTRGKVFTRVNLNRVMENVIKNLSLTIEERDGVINTGNLPVIAGDESQMIQLFQNFVVNGLKFNINRPEINVVATEESTHYKISIRDNGIGIEPQYFGRIFQIFQRLHPGAEYEGTGIGLAICKRIVERHGGAIWVESEPGKGSEFIFTIPKMNLN